MRGRTHTYLGALGTAKFRTSIRSLLDPPLPPPTPRGPMAGRALPPAELARRIDVYTARAAAGLPLFEPPA